MAGKNEDSETGNHTLIIANPGTGKTTELVSRVISLLKEGVKEEKILCITYTQKATEEMRTRIATTIKAEGLVEKFKAEKIAVHTFHSYANSYLQELGDTREIAGNNLIRYSVFRSFMNDEALNYGTDYIISEIVPKSENAIKYLKSFGILPDGIDLKKAAKDLEKIYKDEGITNVTLDENKKFLEYFVKAFSDYEKGKELTGKYMDYNDMLLEFIKKYDNETRHYSFVLVDELQDVNQLEGEIALQSGDTLFLVGDRKQAIFGFQGGSVRNFSEFMKMKGITKRKKSTNYRSFQGILDYSKAHFLANTIDKSYKEELEDLAADRKGKAKVCVINSKNQVNSAVSKLIELTKGHEKDDRRYAIITRTNGQIVSASKLLDKKGMEYSTTTGGYANSEAKREILSYLRGLLYDDDESVIAALFTPFSGLRLQEAFEISEKVNSNKKEGMEYAKVHAKEFFAMKEAFKMEKLPSLFLERILPISVSIGKEYYLSAASIQADALEFFEIVAHPDRKAFFDYFMITQENYEPIEKKSKITLTTVHKAKGLEFDAVIYLPTRDPSSKMSFIDAVVYAIILASKGIDIRDELEEEHLRVDFVAFTRARDELYIIAKERDLERYALDGLAERETMESDLEAEPLSWKYDEAYTLFVNKRYDDSKNLLTKKEDWLRQMIANYFRKKTRLSYSLVNGSKEPYEFFKRNILNLEEVRREGLSIGTEVHELAEQNFKGKLDESNIPAKYLEFYRNVKKVNEAVAKKYNAKQIAAEENIILDLKSLFDIDSDATFIAKMDGIFEVNGGKTKYLILDYKTDKVNEEASNHRRQLAVYKRVYSVAKGIKESEISVALGFVGLRGKINTGRIDWELDDADPKRNQIETFEKHLARYVNYMKDPESFVKDLLAAKETEPFYQRISEALSQSN